jgi:hypothetical protein
MKEDDDDPFAPKADPYPQDPRVDRRTLAKLLMVAPLAAASACAHRPIGCAPREGTGASEGSCRHRFCRYYRPT